MHLSVKKKKIHILNYWHLRELSLDSREERLSFNGCRPVTRYHGKVVVWGRKTRVEVSALYLGPVWCWIIHFWASFLWLSSISYLEHINCSLTEYWKHNWRIFSYVSNFLGSATMDYVTIQKIRNYIIWSLSCFSLCIHILFLHMW